MRYLFLFLAFVSANACAQQINPVPDYIFRNQMSVGRNAATDTAAYLSIGPRFGATKGFQPPMVVDTATFSGSKRNGLTIFSVQRNKYVYWDSIGAKWAEMAGTAGNALTSADTANLLSTRAWRQKGDDSLGALIGLRVRYTDTASMLTPYVRKSDTSAMLSPYVHMSGIGLSKSGQAFNVDTVLLSTRAWRQKGIDSIIASSISGSGTNGRSVRFTGANTLANGAMFDDGSRIGIGATIDNNAALTLGGYSSGVRTTATIFGRSSLMHLYQGGTQYFWMEHNNGFTTISHVANSGDQQIYIPGYLNVASSGETGLQVAGSPRLIVGGKIKVVTIDSTSSPINMLYQGTDGIIRKSSVPSGGGGVTSVSAGTGMSFSTITTTGSVSADTTVLSTRARTKKQIDSIGALITGVAMTEGTVTIESGWNFSRPVGDSVPTSQVIKVSDGYYSTVSLNIAVHKTTATFTTDSWVKVGTIPAGFRPNNVIHGQLPSIVSGNQFTSQSNVTFSDDMKTSGHMAFRIQEDGDIEVNVDQVIGSVDLSGAAYVLFPIAITFPILTINN